MLVRITAPHFCAGVELDEFRAAPILKYMIGWDLPKITAYCASKGWQWELLDTFVSSVKEPDNL